MNSLYFRRQSFESNQSYKALSPDFPQKLGETFLGMYCVLDTNLSKTALKGGLFVRN